MLKETVSGRKNSEGSIRKRCTVVSGPKFSSPESQSFNPYLGFRRGTIFTVKDVK